MAKNPLARAALFFLVASLAGCGGGGGVGSLLGLGGGSCSPHNFTLNFASVGGFGASGVITSATPCFSSASITTDANLAPILGSPFTSTDPSAQVLLYLGATFSAAEYANGLPAFTITLPATVATANRKFYVASNTSGGFAFSWNATAEGPAVAAGSTLSFGSAGGNTTFGAGQEAEFALYSVAGP